MPRGAKRPYSTQPGGVYLSRPETSLWGASVPRPTVTSWMESQGQGAWCPRTQELALGATAARVLDATREGRKVRGVRAGERLLPWLAGHRAGRAEGSGGARAGRASVGTASLRRAPRALRTPPPPPPPPLALVFPPRLPSPLPPRPPCPGSNILRGLEHARLENNTTFQKPFQEQRVPEGKEAGLLLLF